MQNKDKYKTAQEAWDAFYINCRNTEGACESCVYKTEGRSCYFTWLYAEAEAEPPAPLPKTWCERVMAKFIRKD